MSPEQPKLTAACRCGTVEFEAVGAPILSVTCYCASCQEAGRRIEQRSAETPILDADGGTGFILYRKDRVRCARGEEHLEEHRLKPSSPTRRVLATCCDSAMFLEFASGHWLSMYRNRFAAGAPPVEMRVMTKDRRIGVELSGDVPSYRSHSGMFMVKLFAAWFAMGFRVPKISYGKTAR